MCIACLMKQVRTNMMYCDPCANELAEALNRLVGKPFDDLGFWDHIKKSSEQ